jgi:hypothetical protein
MGMFKKIMGFLTDVLVAGRKIGLWAKKINPIPFPKRKFKPISRRR